MKDLSVNTRFDDIALKVVGTRPVNTPTVAFHGSMPQHTWLLTTSSLKLRSAVGADGANATGVSQNGGNGGNGGSGGNGEDGNPGAQGDTGMPTDMGGGLGGSGF